MIELKHRDKIIQLRNTLFWDVDNGSLNATRSRALIIERVLTRGNMEEFKQLKEFYSKDELRQVVVKIGYLDPRTLNFISTYLDIPKEDFLCYRKRLSTPLHWNS
jgi:hypothetical protein